MDQGGETYGSPPVQTMTVSAQAQPASSATGIVSAATRPAPDIVLELGVTADQGLTNDEVARRRVLLRR